MVCKVVPRDRELLAHVVDLAVREAAAGAGAGAGCECRVDRVDVERDVQGSPAVRVDALQRHLDDARDAVLVDVSHREDVYVAPTERRGLLGVDVPQPDVREAGLVDAPTVREPVEARQPLVKPEKREGPPR